MGAEKKNGHLLSTTQALLFQRSVPKHYWGEAVLTATHIINRLPTRVLNHQSPMGVLSHFYPCLTITHHLAPRIFGCVSNVHIHGQTQGKLDHRALKTIFVGYSSTQKGYKCYHPSTRKFNILGDVTFYEPTSFFPPPPCQKETMLVDDKDYFLLDLLLVFPAPTLEPQQLELGDTQPESKLEHVSLVEGMQIHLIIGFLKFTQGGRACILD